MPNLSYVIYPQSKPRMTMEGWTLVEILFQWHFFPFFFLVYHKKITKTITTLQKKYAIVHQSCTLCFKTQGKNNHKKTCFCTHLLYTLVTDQVPKK